VERDYAAALAPSFRRNDSLPRGRPLRATGPRTRATATNGKRAGRSTSAITTLQSYLRFPVLGTADAGSGTNTGGSGRGLARRADPSGPVEVPVGV